MCVLNYCYKHIHYVISTHLFAYDANNVQICYLQSLFVFVANHKAQ